MIVQCQACQTRFRLADEKVKPEGTKVRCSKCKEIFTVTPPEPEPVEESVDFGSFNMEAVEEETSEKAEPEEAQAPTEPPAPDEASATPTEPIDESQSEPPAEEESGEIDFSGLEAEMGSEAGAGDELADDFSFADTSEPAEEEQVEDSAVPESDFSMSEDERIESTGIDQEDFGAAFEESDEPDEAADSMAFDFSEEQTGATEEDGGFELESTSLESEASFETSFDTEEADATATDEFSFDEEQAEASQEETEDFAFGDDEDASAFSFDEEPAETGGGAADEFSFDEENPFGDDSSSEWSEDDSGEAPSFDFEEPQFDTEAEAAPAAKPPAGGDEGGLQFGEIDFASDGDEGESNDFASATLETQEPEPFSPREQSPPPSRSYDDDEPLPAPPPPKKSSLSRVLVLLVLLLVVLGGAAGFLVMQGGTLNLQTLTEYLPFLKEYVGEAPAAAPTQSIDINISGSSYVNGQAGQMLVIQGAAVNKHPASRSSITIKGVLLDANGKTLLQQTVFCGNRLSDEALETMPFKTIEEAMNNEFGDGLSNMNVASGASIPFTIVFRNLPDGIANINVEVVDSKPGAS